MSDIREILSHRTKEELLATMEFFAMNFKTSEKKQELVESLASYMQDNPHEWLSQLTMWDLRILKNLSDEGPEVPVTIKYSDSRSFVELLNIIEADVYEDTIDLHLSKPVYDIVHGQVEGVIKEKIANGDFDLERLVMGVLNAYGVLSLHDFVDILFDQFDDSEDAAELGRRIAQFPLVRLGQYTEKGEIYLVNPFMNDFSQVMKDRRKHSRKVRKFARFTKEQYMDAGGDMPYCAWGLKTPEGLAMTAVLTSLGYQGETLRDIEHTIWLCSQHSESEEANEAMFDCISSKMEEIPTFEGYKACIDTIVDYANSVPKWVLRGHNANDVGILKVDVKVEESPSEDESDPDEMADAPEVFGVDDFAGVGFAGEPHRTPVAPVPEAISQYYKYNMAVNHVGPDDPCPCGSGHPYRLCHGRHLS